MLLKQYERELDKVLARAEGSGADMPAWVKDLKAKGLRTHREHGVPTPKVEDWKYTPLRDFSERDWKVAEPGPAVFKAELPRYDAGSVRIVLVNGRYDRNLSETAPGVTTVSLRDAMVSHGALIEARLAQAGPDTTKTVDREIRPDVFTFGELNTASFEDGLFLMVEPGVEVAPLLEVVHVLCAEDGEPTIAFPRILVIVEDGARIRFTETYVTDGCNDSACVPVTEVFVGGGADVEHVRVQDQCACSTHIGLWQTRQQAESSYRSYNVCFGSKLGRLDQGIWIGGEQTVTRLDGVVCANGEQHLDNHTRLDHAVPNGNSFEIYKQVIDDSATVVFNGKIFVHQDAQKTDAKQTNQALLLSPNATIDSKPQLEIFADDVKCTHGATVGQLEDLPLFYMRQRGVPRDAAEAVLVYAFAAEVLELISIEPVRRALEKRLYSKLGIDLT
ncbi:MAG: Fe-S cluster assembly protein SufD [Armatimonadetes bacterium]|nr:Fe-S cluster assembly protein SufD [Armatimonadota bacterium]